MTTGMPLPKVYAGIIPCDRVFFTRFMWASPFDRFPYFIESLFVECLLEASSRRPLKAGHKGLFLEAARLFATVAKPWAQQFYAGYGGTTDWSDRDLEALAVEIAMHFTDDPIVKRRTETALKAIRDRLYFTEFPSNTERANVVMHTGEFKIVGGIQGVIDVSLSDNSELPADTFNRTLDYIEHLRHLPGYSCLFSLKRDLTSYLRVHHAVFGQSYLLDR